MDSEIELNIFTDNTVQVAEVDDKLILEEGGIKDKYQKHDDHDHI